MCPHPGRRLLWEVVVRRVLEMSAQLYRCVTGLRLPLPPGTGQLVLFQNRRHQLLPQPQTVPLELYHCPVPKPLKAKAGQRGQGKSQGAETALCGLSGGLQEEELQLSDWFNPRRRVEVITTTNWLAPVVWEGTFDREVLEKYYRKWNISVGLAVFAVGRITDQYLDPFLQSASKFFMPGYSVIFYIMVDRHMQLPKMNYNPLHSFQIHIIGEERWWNNLDLMRMKLLAEHIHEHIRYEVDYLFSMSANLVFQNEFGVETLSTSVAQLHAWWYFRKTNDLPYERRPMSAAYIPFGLGDFYYSGAIIGGVPFHVLDLTQEYLKAVVLDAENGLNSTYEKYLNKYFYLNKPTKILSPEYCWDSTFKTPRQVWYMKIAQYPMDSL
ncbi:glycosyltransferase 6 domain-containing protein 1 isoform X2 [Cricetulus griseus]|uniref:Glycosyltransferase 6 domain-containing protein 1 isoform X2 n=1 Tax=Cricetulus griseus TaxID=10029 RepID=A0A9J7G814_CRIGR|nr:glycosyltransferase 6 domain-containing protein 1 isoform X2 [Cricetulus griseus]